MLGFGFQGTLRLMWPVFVLATCSLQVEQGALEKSSERGWLVPGPRPVPQEGECYAHNLKEFKRNPKGVNVSWCRGLNTHGTSNFREIRESWEKTLPPNRNAPLQEYDCVTQTISQFGSVVPSYNTTRCRKLEDSSRDTAGIPETSRD